MEQPFVLTEDMLWDYADGFLSPEEKTRVHEYLLLHPEQMSRLDAIADEKRRFASLPTERPNAGFADRVMAAWVSEQAGSRQIVAGKGKDWVVYSIAAAMGLFLLLPILLIFISAPASATDLIPAEYLPQTPTIPWTEIFASPVMRFGMPLVLLFFSFRFLDQYLQQKKMLAKLQA